MAFHFQPQADSSDDEAVDISAWQTGAVSKAKSPAARAPVANMGGNAEDDQAELDATLHQQALELATGSGAEEEEDMLHIDDTQQEHEEENGGIVAEDSSTPALSVTQHKTTSRKRKRRPDAPHFASSFTSINKPAPPSPSMTSESEFGATTRKTGRVVLEIPRVRLEELEDDFVDYTEGADVVRMVKKEVQREGGEAAYKVEFEDRHVEEIPFEELLQYDNGREALSNFENASTPETTPESSPRAFKMSSTRLGRKSARRDGYVNTVDVISDDDEAASQTARGKRKRKTEQTKDYDDQGEEEEDFDEPLDTEEDQPKVKLRLRNGGASTRRSLRGSKHPIYAPDLQNGDDEDDDSVAWLQSDIPGHKSRKARTRNSRSRAHDDDEIGYEHRGERQSGRSTRHQKGMQEVGEDDIYRSDSDDGTRAPAKPKVVAAREQFKTLPRNDEFRMRHTQDCETCGQGSNFAPLIYCQGCTLAYHKSCLGPRNQRDHLVTQIEGGESVLQCRRCVAFPRKKDPTAPDQGKCADCHEHGNACLPFRSRKTTAQEQKYREDNDGQDPSYDVDPSRIGQADNVLFRCITCWRAFHFEHLPSRSGDIMDIDGEVDAEQRFREYSRDWKCKDCLDMPAKVSGIIAWKPIDEDSYDPGIPFENVDEDEKAYLVKWDGMSYFRACWMPGAWVWGVTPHSTRKAFSRREESHHPKMRTEDAIPEDYLRTDIVLDIKYTSIVEIRAAEIDKARIREVDKALIKYKGLGYEDAVWEAPPNPDDGDRWTDFVTAYNDWVLGRYIKPPKGASLKTRLDKARSQDFAKLEKTTQPENVEGGELMKYQIEGLNWLYFKWFTQKNAILADEMGLGKTIQIIGFLATLVADWNCFPFLVVVPNSTCPNWRREIKRWAPSLRVVAYYGSKESRDRAYRYELYPEGGKDLRCHVVVTSYDAASDDSCRGFFRGVQWQGLVVDEGQRLKNDKNLLYSALGALKTPFRILLTGTPLQNNARELFNLLHFLDENYNAARLEEEYADLDSAKIIQLHDMIRPFFLRRTKAQVLTFLPPMAQIILPVSMSIVQKKVYRTILAKNPEFMKAIFSPDSSVKQAERASLSNILMQLRKCLCHPFVYNKGIEERNVSHSMSHRNLVDASSKLALLEILLPKLKERGHRVLIFSQFLDMLDMVEDFLDGMELRYQRLDGSINALQKQKRIDAFNAPESPLFAFLLSTRAGGVGINLASADTVIILDPDFNPHQDIQALSRAHRIGQHKKVLCFQLVTRASAEERIMQMGRKKLALDHVLIQEMDADDANENDLVSILRHGASELFEDEGEQDISYDSLSVDRLLDRSHMEDTKSGADKSAEAQFSFARVWANDQAALQDEFIDPSTEQADQAPDPGVWANILRERERAAAEEAAAKADAYGRGRRARGNVDYNNDRLPEGADGVDLTPARGGRKKEGDESDTDFQDDGDVDDEPFDGELDDRGGDVLDGEDVALVVRDEVAKRDAGPKKNAAPTFKRSTVPQIRYIPYGLPTPPDTANPTGVVRVLDGINCIACWTFHPVGSCPLRMAGIEYCNLCGMAHFGSARVCPHIQSETQVREMLNVLKDSNEPEHLVTEARRYLRGLKGNLVQMKKQKEVKRDEARMAFQEAQFQRQRGAVGGWQG